MLDRAGITCNRNTIPDDPRSAFQTSGLRLGTAAETRASAISRANASGTPSVAGRTTFTATRFPRVGWTAA